MQYHVAVIQLILPLLESDYFEGPNLLELERIVVKHAQQSIEILEHARRLYSARYLMPLLSFCIIHVGDTLIRYSPKEPPASDVVEFCLGMLQQAGVGFPLCGPLQELFFRTTSECGVALPANSEQVTSQLGSYGVDDILDACTRLDYKQPVDQSVRHVADNIAEEWPSKWEQIVNNPIRPHAPPQTTKATGVDQQLRIGSLLNP